MRTTTDCQMSVERANMEVDVLVLCSGDQQQVQHNDENILAAIEGELIDDEAVSELVTAESTTLNESRDDDDDHHPVTSRDEGMLTPDDNRSGGVTLATDNVGPFNDESAAFSDVSSTPVSYTTRSDIIESQEEEKTLSNDADVDRRNLTDRAVPPDASIDSAVDCVVGNASHNKCNPSPPANPISDTAFDVNESCHHTETVSETRSPEGEHLETSSVSSAETTSSASVIDTYAVVDSSNVISDVNRTLIVGVPDTESAGNATASCSTDALADNQQTNGLSDEAVRLELADAIDIDAKKKGFRVRFHEDHVTGYHDPPTPWREGWHHIPFICITPAGLLFHCKQVGTFIDSTSKSPPLA